MKYLRFSLVYRIETSQSLRIDIGSMCRVSYVKQLGSGIPFLRAILVTPLNEEGLPIDVGMIEN